MPDHIERAAEGGSGTAFDSLRAWGYGRGYVGMPHTRGVSMGWCA